MLCGGHPNHQTVPPLHNDPQQSFCDGLLQTTDPPEDAARTDSAASNPEGEGPSANPLRLPGSEGQRQQLRALSGEQRGTAQETGVVEQPKEPWTTARTAGSPNRIEEPSDNAQERSRMTPAAREAPRATSSHVSGEAWPLQVRATRREGKSRGGWEGVPRLNHRGN
ncbi:hypothetical protein NDU88_006426 [Pleurodeles waltl]|uniref:Uncharacterized protein n=1 Tax=Pleurodeles waltl TaxID=8319 RepID=A0AAV7RPH2_PLEWA|nr:hypothetical protein NDU88_006426 [Pleurodeles waltl]